MGQLQGTLAQPRAAPHLPMLGGQAAPTWVLPRRALVARRLHLGARRHPGGALTRRSMWRRSGGSSRKPSGGWACTPTSGLVRGCKAEGMGSIRSVCNQVHRRQP